MDRLAAVVYAGDDGEARPRNTPLPGQQLEQRGVRLAALGGCVDAHL